MKNRLVLVTLVLVLALFACSSPPTEEAAAPTAQPVAEAPTPEPTQSEPTEASTAEPDTLSSPWVRAVELPVIPHDLALDAQGNLYVVELGAPRIRKVDDEGNELASWGEAGDGEGQFAFDPPPEAPPLDGGFVVVDQNGTVYVSDSYNNRVQLFDGEGQFLDMWTSFGAEETPFDNPGPISVDAEGNIYVADFGGLHQFDANGDYVQSLMGAGETVVDEQGALYTTIAFENTVVKMAPDAEPVFWGGEGLEDGQFITPMWVALDDDGVLISDHSGRIQKFDFEGNFVAVWSDPGDAMGPFTGPSPIARGGNGDLYVATKDRNIVYVMQP